VFLDARGGPKVSRGKWFISNELHIKASFEGKTFPFLLVNLATPLQ
jgi:hypothetical protein